MLRRFAHRFSALAIMLAIACSSSLVMAQADGGGGGGGPGGGGGGGGAGGGGGFNTNQQGGVEVDANGVLRSSLQIERNGQLERQAINAAKARLGKDLQTPSSLRKVSLTRLEAEAKKLLAAGQPIPDEMRFLAGLTRITHVFYYPETRDIVIAGPAEGFFSNTQGRMVGLNSGEATLYLEDLVVALRAFGPQNQPTRLIACSIDPTADGLVRFKHAYETAKQQFHPSNAAAVTQLFREALGMQTVTVEGVSPQTHFARVLVEADYHMKLIGIGLEKTPTKIISFIDKASPTSVSKNSLQRWYFQPNYECVRVTPDQHAMQLVGGGVKLVGEDERVGADGSRKNSGGMNGASRAFCNSFTNNYEILAKKVPLFGQLRNVIDMSIVAAYIQHADLYQKAGWSLDCFGDESQAPVETGMAPTQVEPVINAVWKGSYFMTPIGGGVNIQPRVALNKENVKLDDDGSIATAHQEGLKSSVGDGQWWWD